LFPSFPLFPSCPTNKGTWDCASAGIDRGPVLGGMTG